MGRRAATALHLALFLVGAALYAVFVIPRWWVLTGDIPASLATAGRIAAGVPIALAALPVVLNLKRALKPEHHTPELALRLRAWSLLLHVVGGALIIAAAIAEIWLSPGNAGAWLFGVYGGAAAIALLGALAFHLAFIAEKPPRAPKPPKPTKEPRRTRAKRRKAKSAEDAESAESAEDADDADDAKDAADAVPSKEAEPDGDAAETGDTHAEAEPEDETDPEPEATDAEPVTAGGLRNRRPSGKTRHRLRR